MSVTQYDTAAGNPNAALPPTGDDAAYISGRYANYAILRQDRPHAIILPITVNLPTVAELQALELKQIAFDIESGDLQPIQAPDCVKIAHDAGIPCPVLYGSLDTWEGAGGIWQELSGIFRVDIDFQGWLAHPDAIPQVPAGYAAKQYLFGVEFDTSIILNPQTFYNLAPAPAPSTPEDAVSITAYETADRRVGLAVETTTGEVLHIEQQGPSGVAGQDADWWRKPDGTANWLSLGTPGK